jgi:SAM-dependent MidA family methyltransferase
MDGGAFAAALEVHMVEVSTPLRRMQWDNLRCEGAHPPPRVDNAAAVLPDGSFGDIRLGMLPGPGVGADADGDRDTQAGGIKDRQMAHDKVELTHTGVSQLNGRPVTWHRALSEVPRGPLVLLAHELFDALPVQQLKRTEHGWSERVVDIADQDRCNVHPLDRSLDAAGTKYWRRIQST